MGLIEVHMDHVKWAHEFFRLTTDDVTPEQAHWQPPGTANPLAAVYAHAVLTEDAAVQTLLRDDEPLFAAQWRGRTGISEPQLQISRDWAQEVEMDLEPLQAYAQALFERTEATLAGFEPEDLDREIDLTEYGMGVKTGHQVVAELVVSHLNNMIGEIAVLKGLQGAKGYPF